MWTRNVATVVITIAAALLALTVSVARGANNAEQIVFSGQGLPPVSSEPFGFWVWCQNDQAGPSVGKSNYETDCNGALYFYDRGVVVHVTGEVSEPSEGTYVMDLESSDGSVSCTLTNSPPISSGPHNVVTASDCTVNGETVTGLVSNTAVVKATGPG